MILVRPIAEGDRPALRELFLLSRRQAFHWMDAAGFQPGDFDEQTIGEDVWVAEREGGIIGLMAVWVPDRFIHHLYVHPDCHRQGVGEAMVDACAGYYGKPLLLKCLKQNSNAMAFYQAQGWEATGEGCDELGDYFLLQLN